MRLLTLTLDEITAVSKEMEEESKALRKDLFRMCWFMRGSLSVEQAYMLDYEERQIIGDIIKSNLETTKETKMPFF